MVEEVRELLKSGVSAGMLKFYGLEYRFITSYIQGEITYEELFSKLNTAIHQFAKRQETWWRRMEKRGTVLHRIDGRLTPEQKKDAVLKIFQQR
jgi:tRNA dimethylallyltransferase